MARVLLGKYCPNSSLLDCAVPNSASHGWRSICIGRDLLKPHVGRIIGSGTTTPLWNSPWLSLDTPTSPMGPPPAESQGWTVSDLLEPGTSKWNIDLIKRTLPAHEKEILQLKPSKQGALDRWAWLLTQDGTYNTKSGYYTAHSEDSNSIAPQTSQASSSFSWTANIWNVKTSPKTKLLIWKIVQQAIPVGANLNRGLISGDAKCPHCSETESELHLFFCCPFATRVWALAPFNSNFPSQSFTSITEGISSANRLICLPPSGIGGGPLAPWILWMIWMARNKMIFNKERIRVEEATVIAIIRAKEWQSAQLEKLKSIVLPTPSPVNQVQQNENLITCFVDASWISEPKAGLRWVFTDQHEQILQQGSDLATHVSSPLMAEALATLTAVEVAIASGFTHLSIASDSQTLVKALNLKLHSKDLHGILHDILDLSNRFSSCNFRFIPRTQNQIANELAKRALSMSLPCM
ncbi:PREDICTED: uncharacterized protein LOC104720143 [Camelina sativa]|uniref:Uncharacterized protein LOC104720143 n=1 Tax=Camelina sativa TaxID=90675 RepID=A0ABM0U624_CAMSA|nr:PREDICTED: uncharacterized protein LOC104720143 [Camelina sativa]